MKFINETGLAHLISNIKSLLSDKVDKVTGKGLSTNDYDSTAKTKVDAIPESPEYTDTVTTINGKTGVIAKADIVALGIPAQDTVVDISGKADITYVDGKVKTDVPVGAKFTDTVYTHPDNHPASVITQDASNRFVTDTEKSTWNSKSDTDTVTTVNGKTGAISKADIVALGIPSQDTDTTYSEITTAEIDTGTASTLRTITARRLKYLLDKIVALFPTKTSELTNDSGFLTSVTKSDVGLSNVDNVKQMPISGGVLENYREKLTTVSASGGSINLSLGNVFVHTPSGNSTYSITNAVNLQAHSFTLIITMGSTVRTLTFPSSVKWQGGEIPDLTTASKTYVLTFMTVDGGTTWLGMFGGEF